MKKYETGMYGGKFMPLHKGHEYCIKVAAKECEKVYVILFHGGLDEERILAEKMEPWLLPSARMEQIKRVCEKYKGLAEIIPCEIDISSLKELEPSEEWDAETPLVRAIVGEKLDAVYGSEEAYGEYFKRAYPEAVHRLVDVRREKYPISGTHIREMKNKGEREKWMV